MDYQRQRIENQCYPVEMAKMDGKNYIVRSDNGLPIKEVSEQYTIVQNRDLLLPVAEKFGFDKVSINMGRGHMFAKVYTNRSFDLGDGDIVKECITIRNSYNKTRSFHFSMGAYRLVCKNGLMSMVSGFDFTKRHIGEINVGSVVNDVLNTYQTNTFEFWKALKQIPLALETELDLVKKWKPFDLKDDADNDAVRGTVARKLQTPESLDNQRNAWGLFNAMNWGVARQHSGRCAYNKRIVGDGRAEEFLQSELGVR